jgi:hypothetical protein
LPTSYIADPLTNVPQVYICDESWQISAECADVLCELVRMSPRGPHGVLSLAIFFMGIGQLGPIKAKFISESEAWKTANFAVLGAIHRQQPGPYQDFMLRVSSYEELSQESFEFLVSCCNKADTDPYSQGSDMLLLVPLRKAADEHNTKCFAQLPGKEYISKARDECSRGVAGALRNSPLQPTSRFKVGMKAIVNMTQVC